MRKIFLSVIMGILPAVFSSDALAGPHLDNMTKCLIDSTSESDRAVLMKWMFAVLALHPHVKFMSSLTDEQRAKVTEDAAKQFQRLISEACVNETRNAIKNEGRGVIRQSFNQLGQIALAGLRNDPAVSKGIGELTKYIDKEKFEKALYP